jgi:hypothetical protein
LQLQLAAGVGWAEIKRERLAIKIHTMRSEGRAWGWGGGQVRVGERKNYHYQQSRASSFVRSLRLGLLPKARESRFTRRPRRHPRRPATKYTDESERGR